MRRWIWVVGLMGCSDYMVTAEQPHVDVPDDPDTDAVVDDDSTLPDGVVAGGLEGTICDTFESGLVGAEAMIEHAYGVTRATTDAEGYFKMEELPAGEHVLVVVGPDYFLQEVVYVPPNEITRLATDECSQRCDIPIPCVGLAEAISRGVAEIQLLDQLQVRNTSADIDICIEDWGIVLSDESQDAAVGSVDPVHIGPGRHANFPYGEDVFGGAGNNAWYCVEQYQYTRSGSYYTYNGSLAPDPIYDFIHDRTDTDADGAEDHNDYPDGNSQTQYNVWHNERDHPAVVVGRANHVVRMSGDGSRPTVTVQAMNLGQNAVTTSVVEVVQPGFKVMSTSPTARITIQSDGSSVLSWTVSLDAAQPDPAKVVATIYDVQDLSYTLALGDDACRGRCVGSGAMADWADNAGSGWRSWSEPMIIENCSTE